jgi:Glycosyltransferase like family
MALIFVTATRWTQAEFDEHAPLGRSLAAVYQVSPLELRVFANNTRALALNYNAVIDAAAPDDVLVFVHDDVVVDDWMLGWRLQEALLHFDVVGVAGNRRQQPEQTAWLMLPHTSQWDAAYLSGAIMHGSTSNKVLTFFGSTPAKVALLDGVLLAARAGRLQTQGVRFDPQFDFHLYDLDFCRSAQAAGLSLGTWPLAITHASGGGSYFSPDWQRNADAYLKKWGA